MFSRITTGSWRPYNRKSIVWHQQKHQFHSKIMNKVLLMEGRCYAKRTSAIPTTKVLKDSRNFPSTCSIFFALRKSISLGAYYFCSLWLCNCSALETWETGEKNNWNMDIVRWSCFPALRKQLVIILNTRRITRQFARRKGHAALLHFFK